jgi:hypothetical protein
MKMYGGMIVQIHVFLTSALVGSGHLHAPAASLQGKRVPRYLLDRGLGGPQSRYERLGEERKFLTQEGEYENHG